MLDAGDGSLEDKIQGLHCCSFSLEMSLSASSFANSNCCFNSNCF